MAADKTSEPWTELNNEIGFGTGTTWFSSWLHNTEGDIDPDLVAQVEAALSAGFRHLDFAEMYGNERECGLAISNWLKSSSTTREQLWITSKVWFSMSSSIEKGCRATIDRLGCKYLDLYLIHAPIEFLETKAGETPPSSLRDVWREMEGLVDLGLVRRIGVSNFRGSDIRDLCSFSDLRIRPYLNQVEFHPYLQQPVLADLCRANGIRLAAYGPLSPLFRKDCADGPVLPVVEGLAAKYNVSTSAVLLRYTQQKGYVPVTTTRNADRLKDYLSSVERFVQGSFPPPSITLEPEEIAAIDEAGNKLSFRQFWGGKIPPLTDAGLL